jgi:hypothetical protein
MTDEGAVGAFLGLLSGLRRPPDLGYLYRRILPEKVASCSNKTFLFLQFFTFGPDLTEISTISGASGAQNAKITNSIAPRPSAVDSGVGITSPPAE